MEDDEACQVYQTPHSETWPTGLQFGFTAAAGPAATRPREVLRQDYLHEQVQSRYKQDLELVQGSCLYCRALRRVFDYTASQCAWRFDWIEAKKTALAVCHSRGRPWMALYTACWRCFQPQTVCRVADPKYIETAYRFPDVVLPLYYGVYQRPGQAGWFQ
jgi:hypothetical protein